MSELHDRSNDARSRAAVQRRGVGVANLEKGADFSEHPHSKTRMYHVDVHLSAPANNGPLLKLVSVFHSRGVTVTDLHYTMQNDGSSRISADFHCPPEKATTLAHSLSRAIQVLDVVLNEL